MKHIHITEEIQDIGNTVVCDYCNENYTDSEESGGIYFGGNALCPKCAPAALESIRQFDEERFITDRCPPGMSYRDWVLRIRDGDNTVRIITKEIKDQ